MKSYCVNELTIVGDYKYLFEFDNCFKNNGIQFNVESQHLTDTAYRYFDFSNYLCYYREPLSTGSRLTGVLNIEKIKNYSFSAFIPPCLEDLRKWDNWKLEKWDTRSDAEDLSIIVSNESCLKYRFRTALYPPIPVIVQMISDFPKLNFEYKYIEDRKSYAGIIRAQKGQIIEDIYKNKYSEAINDLIKTEFQMAELI